MDNMYGYMNIWSHVMRVYIIFTFMRNPLRFPFLYGTTLNEG